MKKICCILTLALPGLYATQVLSEEKAVYVKDIKGGVDENIQSLMKEQDIPGMAVGIVHKGKIQVFTYGAADTEKKRPVTGNTLFELGSVSKTFTGLAGAVAVQQGTVNLSDSVRKYWAALPATPWNNIKMLHLATYSAGVLPLQLPDKVTDEQSLKDYYQTWQPQSPAGAVRAYSNASIGLFGALVAKKNGVTFERYLTENILNPLNLRHTFIHVPAAEQKNYAWGYRKGLPVRVSPGMLDAEAYGIKSSVTDMAHYVDANMRPEKLSGRPVIQQAILTAQMRYLLTDGMYQGLGWEMYNWPASPQQVVRGSSNDVALKPQPTQTLEPPQSYSSASWVHKTGSTNGFGSYVAFIPERQTGIVILANKSYPNPIRVSTAQRIIDAVLKSD